MHQFKRSGNSKPKCYSSFELSNIFCSYCQRTREWNQRSLWQNIIHIQKCTIYTCACTNTTVTFPLPSVCTYIYFQYFKFVSKWFFFQICTQLKGNNSLINKGYLTIKVINLTKIIKNYGAYMYFTYIYNKTFSIHGQNSNTWMRI